MPLIEYRGLHPAVDVPLLGLGDIAARTPVEVSAEVAEQLTLGGTSSTWVDVTPAAARGAKAAPAKAVAAAGSEG